MRLKVSYDYETSEHAGAGGTFQIESISDADTGKDLSKRVDQGLHFSDTPELLKYLRKEFGARAQIVEDEPE